MAAYADLSREDLVARLIAYEGKGPAPPARGPRKPRQLPNGFHFAGHATRHVALMVSYQGWNYAGLALQNTGYPTVESELIKALEKCRLIEAGGGWEASEFSRCGRTDRGVSGEGQVVNLWVRSNRSPNDGGEDLGSAWRPPKEEKVKRPKKVVAGTAEEGDGETAVEAVKPPPIELSYARILNAVLPPDIRILGWSPVPPEFDSRFSCQHRHYKYDFLPNAIYGRPPLDLEKMAEGANNLVGEHDFRNLCKLDGSKQIENHSRRVIKAYFEPGTLPGHYVFNLIGSAFLWHQVRHIIAILFLVGHGLEPPSVISDLLDVSKHPAKPTYQMGNPIPLTLHECAYKPDELDWRYGPYDGPWASLSPEAKEAARPMAEHGLANLERELEERRQEFEIRAWQVGAPLRKVHAMFGERPISDDGPTLFTVGAGEHIQHQRYTPVMSRPTGDTPDTVNRKWREGKERKKAEAEAAEAATAAKEAAKAETEAVAEAATA